jgi:hypothetical protein
MKARFVQNKEYDGFMIWQMLKADDPSGVKNRAKSMGISEEQFERIRSAKSFDEAEKCIKEIIEERYKKYGKQIEDALKSYQESWDEISDVFSVRIEAVTEHKWKFDEYLVVLSPIHPGVSNRNDNKVIRWIFEDPLGQRRITAHEILMIHLWDILDESFPEHYADHESKKEHDTSFLKWALNEITAVAVLGLEPELNELWSSRMRGFDGFLTNYPQLDELKMQLKDIYLKRVDFQDYLRKSMALLKTKSSSQSFRFIET